MVTRFRGSGSFAVRHHPDYEAFICDQWSLGAFDRSGSSSDSGWKE